METATPSKKPQWLATAALALPWMMGVSGIAYALISAIDIYGHGPLSPAMLDWLILSFALLTGSAGVVYFRISRHFSKQKEKYYRSLIENSSDLITVFDLDGTIRYESPSIERILGYKAGELYGKVVFEFMHPDDVAQAFQNFRVGVCSPGKPQICEFRFKHKDGSWRMLESIGSCLPPSPEGVRIIINSRDVTERYTLTQKLRLLQLAASSVSDGIVVCDASEPDMPLLYINPAFEKMTGYIEAEILGKNLRFLQRENRNQPGIDKLREAIKKGEACDAIVLNYRKDGTPFWNEIRIRPVQNPEGLLTHYVGIKTDVTERIHANQALKESEERFRQLAENIPEVFWLSDPELTKIFYVNPSYENIIGRTCESLYKNPRSFMEVIHPDDRAQVMATVGRSNEGFDLEHRIIRPGGEIRWIRARTVPVRDTTGKVYRIAGVAEDITEARQSVENLRSAKKKLEETQAQLVQSEKLAGIGQLAAGVAHELNNPLSGVMGFSQLLLDDPELSGQHRKDVETILGQSQRCKTIIQNLLQFSRRRDPKVETLDLIVLLKATLNLVAYEFTTSGIKMVQTLPSSLPPIHGDSNQLQQVFVNLLTNAQQAMAGCSKQSLTVEAGHTSTHSYIRIRDTGAGIAPEIMSKIFDPFFTTKPVGQGTGLGLSICYGIIQEHAGKITVESKPEEGSTFTVELPIYDE